VSIPFGPTRVKPVETNSTGVAKTQFTTRLKSRTCATTPEISPETLGHLERPHFNRRRSQQALD
jgi:hypothetical protein